MKLDDFWRFEIPKTAVRFLPKINEKPSSILHEKGYNRALIGSKTGRTADSVP